RALPRATDGLHRTGQPDVVDVVPGTLRQRTVRTPAGDPPVDQPRVARVAVRRAETHPLGHAGPEALHEHVGTLDQAHDHLDTLRSLGVDADRAAAALQRVVLDG